MRIAFCLLLSVAGLHAQAVRAPRAQALIDTLLKEHPEIQTIGLHVTPPGQTENVNIACSKPGKVGKRSAPIDMEVMATGKPSLRMASKGAFDIGVPIGDAAGRKLGMIVVVIPANRAKDANDAMRQVLAIRDILQSRIAGLDALFVGATVVDSPMVMVGQTPLPDLRGGFGQLAVDAAGDRLFAVANENNSTEVFDLAGEHLKSEPGVALPPGLALNTGTAAKDIAHRRRFEADSSGKIRVVGEASGKVVTLLDGAGETGDITYDTAGRRLFVTGSSGIAIFRQVDADHYRTISRFGTMGGFRSIYVPSRKMFYILHGKNVEDGAGLQVYEVADEPLFPIRRHRLWGYMDKSGTVMIEPAYQEALTFSDGMAPVKIDGLYGYIDPQAKIILKPQFDEARFFHHGLAPVRKGKLWGYIKPDGEFAIPVQYDSARSFQNDVARVSMGGRWGYIDFAGKLIVPAKFDGANGFVDDLAPVSVGKLWGFIDKKGAFVIQPRFELAHSFGEGLADVKIGGKCGYIDKTGQLTIQLGFDDAGEMSDGLAPVKSNKKWGFIKPDGTYALQPAYDAAKPFRDGLAEVAIGNRMAYIDRAGKIVWQEIE